MVEQHGAVVLYLIIQPKNMDPLTFPLFMNSGFDAKTIDMVGSSTSSSQTITLPADIRKNDFILFVDQTARASSGGVTPTNIIPSGYTQAVTVPIGNSTTSVRATVSYKISDGNDSGATITGMTDSGGTRKIAVVFRRSSVTGIASIESVVSIGTAGDPPAQTIVAGNVPCILIGIAGNTTGSGVSSSFSPTPTNSILNNSLILYYLIFNQNSTPTNAAIDMPDQQSNNCLIGFRIQM